MSINVAEVLSDALEEKPITKEKKCFIGKVVSEHFEAIYKMLLKGFSRNYIFRLLQSKGVFSEKADVSGFYRALDRACKRRNAKIPIPAARRSYPFSKKSKKKAAGG